MKVHHIGYLVKHIERAMASFALLGYAVERDIVYDPDRQVDISFLVNGETRVELIMPKSKTSPLYPLLAHYKNAPYHICYQVPDMDEAVERLRGSGMMMMQPPAPACAIDGNAVAFFIDAQIGILELVAIDEA